MNWEYYNFECWYYRPKFHILSHINFKVEAPLRWKIIAVLYIPLWYILQILIQVVYFVTLPFALVNEIIRE